MHLLNFNLYVSVYEYSKIIELLNAHAQHERFDMAMSVLTNTNTFPRLVEKWDEYEINNINNNNNKEQEIKKTESKKRHAQQESTRVKKKPYLNCPKPKPKSKSEDRPLNVLPLQQNKHFLPQSCRLFSSL